MDPIENLFERIDQQGLVSGVMQAEGVKDERFHDLRSQFIAIQMELAEHLLRMAEDAGRTDMADYFHEVGFVLSELP